jgi:Na+/H+-dicarboxylate symporter
MMIQKIKKYTTTNTLVIAGIILGVLFGILFPEIAKKQQIIGQLFISFLKMLVVPLVFASIYVAIVSLDNVQKLKNLGLKTIGLYMITTALAVILAIVVMNIYPIGEPLSANGLEFQAATKIHEFSFNEMVLSFIPTNVFASLSHGSMMQIIVFAIFFAIASLHIKKEQQQLLQNFFNGVSEAMLIMAEWIIKLTPIGVFSLIAYVVASQGIDVILGLWKYIIMVLFVLILHALITLPALLLFFTKINPYRYLSDIREAPIMAFSTASSAATLPVSMRVVEEDGDVAKESASFVLPLGATVSMDGTAAYLTIAVLYIAHLSGITLSFTEQLTLGVTVVALSIGVAALPSASLVMMVVILNQLGLAVEYVAVIVAVDRILDMARTSLNVTSDIVVVKIVDTLFKRKVL